VILLRPVHTLRRVKRVNPIHRSEEKMDPDEERDATRDSADYSHLVLYNSQGNKVLVNDSTNVGSSLDIVC
jgi:hypothetical protein